LMNKLEKAIRNKTEEVAEGMMAAPEADDDSDDE